MGYYTDWKVSVYPEDRTEEILDALHEESGYKFDKNGYLSEAKWYEANDDQNVTLRNTDVLIIVAANGEETGDIYQIYAWRGTSEHVKPSIVYTPPTWMGAALADIRNQQRETEEAVVREERAMLQKLLTKYGYPE